MSETNNTASHRALRRKVRAYTGYLAERIRRLSSVPERRDTITIAGQYVAPRFAETYVSQPLVTEYLDELREIGFTDEDVDRADHTVWVSLRPRDVPGFLGAEQEPTWAVLTSTDTGMTIQLDGYIHDQADDASLVFVAPISESQAEEARKQMSSRW